MQLIEIYGCKCKQFTSGLKGLADHALRRKGLKTSSYAVQ
jgi:hypothetical protein